MVRRKKTPKKKKKKKKEVNIRLPVDVRGSRASVLKIANEARSAELFVWYPISNKREWNNCFIKNNQEMLLMTTHNDQKTT